VNRDYSSGKSKIVTFFTGIEIEHTPAYNKKTLFVVGIQDIEKITNYYHANNCEHIFFGANHSFDPMSNYSSWKDWDSMILHFLKKDYLCSLDIPLSAVEEFNDLGFCEYNNFIPQIRVPIPYIKLWNYNTMLKIDDRDFKSTNPGVWSHNLHDLMNREKFTDWSKYTLDTVLE
jgi:hypothetical protein